MNAPDKAIEIKAAVTAVLSAITALIGWQGVLLVLWLTAMIVDYITGTAAACKAGEWSSTQARQGLWHKLGSITAVLVAAFVDLGIYAIVHGGIGITLPFEYTTLILPVVACWYLFTELGSIIENAEKLGAPVPQWLVSKIAALKGAADDTGENKSK